MATITCFVIHRLGTYCATQRYKIGALLRYIQLLANMVHSQLRMALGLALVLLGLASAASTAGGGDCPSILEQTSALSDIFAKR